MGQKYRRVLLLSKEKKTKKKAINFVIGIEEVKGNQEVFEKLTKMLAQVEKKSNAGQDTKKMTKTQKENIELAETVLEILASTDQMQAKEVFEKANLSSVQKASALLKKLVESGKATKEVVKGVTYFSALGVVETSQEMEISIEEFENELEECNQYVDKE